MRKIIYSALIVFCLAVALLSSWMIYQHLKESEKQTEIYDNLANLVIQNETEHQNQETSTFAESTVPQEHSILPEYAEIYAQNSDMVGWIYIADTNINYPVMQSHEDPTFYLKHSFDKSASNHGCPYLNANCDVSKPSDNLIIYGHRMKDGSMFAALDNYTSKSFWESHRTITFNTLTQRQTYEVIAVFKVATGPGSAAEFKYYSFTDATSQAEFDNYISQVKSIALYDTGITAEYGDKLLTLSTCEYSNHNGRLVVVAKQTTEE